MKTLVLTTALAGALSNAAAADCAAYGVDYGVVESVREIRTDAANADLGDAFEHALKPRTAHELVIRIDDGRSLILRQGETRRFQPGQRVRVLSSTTGAQLERP